MKKLLLTVLVLLIPMVSHADIAEKTAIRDQLKADIEQVKNELKRCNNHKNLAIGATVLGVAGIATTGAIAIANRNKNQARRETLATEKAETEALAGTSGE